MTDADRVAAAAQKIAELRLRILAGAPATVDAFLALAASMERQPAAIEVLETLRRELHRLRGTAGSFGFSEVSELSGALEERVVRWAEEPGLETAARAAMVTRFATSLRGAFGLPDGNAPSAPVASAVRRLVTLDLPGDVGSALTREGGLRGYHVASRTEGDWSAATLRTLAPHVVATVATSAEAVHRALHGANVPLVILDDGTDPSLTRRAGRLAGTRIMHLRDDPSGVFDVAGQVAERTTWSGATLLVCDDDADVLALVRVIGEEAGLRVVTLGEPRRLLSTLDAVHPSLLLLDINLGNADGLELAAAVRRVERHAELPIIIFSSDSGARTREAVLAAGADEFVAKPVVATELRARILTRLEAARTRLLDQGVHPGTGLLLLERLQTAITGQLRIDPGAPLAVAVARPEGGTPVGAALAGWYIECRRTVDHVRSGSLGDVIAGFTDQCALALVARTPVPAMAAALSRAAGDAPEGKARWHAGVAPRDAAPVDAAALLDAAGDAATAAAASGEVVRPWSPDDALMAPDVIVVEDDPALADMLRYALASFGYSMRMYRTGPEALEALRVMRPRRGRRPLVLLDIDLPGLDGHSLHERLRVERPGVFGIVFASVHASEGDQLRALKSGAIDYLVKPISLRVLMAKLPRWLALAAAGSA